MTPTNPLALAADVRSLTNQLVAAVDALMAALSTPQPSIPKGSATKRADKRLADAGIDALYNDFTTSQLTGKQLAEKHGISLSGVMKRKAMWRKGER